ncbi:MAG: LamG-like jellyroll fold domain-containing protein [Terrimicrobiaceae bacterium]
MKNLLFAVALAGLTWMSSASAGLIHAYNFSPDAPLADDVGGLELNPSGEVAISPEGFAKFDGQGGHLFVEALNTVGGTYTVSFWVRSDSFEPGEEDVALGILAATDKNPYAKGNWGVGLRRNIIRFGGKTMDDGLVNQSLIDKPEPGVWHLITLKFHGAEGVGGWVNEEAFVSFAVLKPTEDQPPPAYKEISKFIIGCDHRGEAGFTGEIADIRIYDDVEWNDAKQVATFQAGPSRGPSPSKSTP